MRDFELEKYFSKWEFAARHHMTASDIESLSVTELCRLADMTVDEALGDTWLGYTETWGNPTLREEIAKTYDTLQGDNILCFAGASEPIYIAMRTLLNKSDHVIVFAPNYQSIETVPLDICQVSGVLLREENDWVVDMDDVRKAIRPNTKLISINFPNNPTGAVLPKAVLDELIALCREHNLYLFSDEVYRLAETNSDDRMPQIADVYERGLSLNVMSKAYGFPGIRVGWLACQDQSLLQPMERYKHYLSICNSAVSEQLSIIALRNREKVLSRNRQLVKQNLQQLDSFLLAHQDKFSWVRPKGGCVGFVKYLGEEGVEVFCKNMVEKKGILLLPASIYHSELVSSSSQHFRIGFGRAKVFQEGLVAFSNALEEL